ncbi:MAG: hypothetical protein C4536_03275 [Actinobacteria bacterium]|nr:MAG: hypothetical protein C4536_03275 [Actinomycetota bacterium]
MNTLRRTAFRSILATILLVSVMACLSAIGLTAVSATSTLAHVYSWKQVNQDGFGIPVPASNKLAHDMVVYNDRLYLGTWNEINGCQVWEYNGDTSWTKVSEDGFGIGTPAHNQAVDSFAILDGVLYASTWNNFEGCQVYRYDGGTDWNQVNVNGFDGVSFPPINSGAHDMVVHEGRIYAGARSGSVGCQVWRYDGGTTWTQVNQNGFGIAVPGDNRQIWSMASCAGDIYAGTWNQVSGCQVWRYDGGTAWTQVNQNGFGIATPVNNSSIHNFTVCNGVLYAESPNHGGGCQVWRYDGGTDWTQVNQNGFGIADPALNEDIWAMDDFKGSLYAGTSNDVNGCQVWRYDGGTKWTQVNANGFGIADPTDNPFIHSMVEYQGEFYAGTYNSTSGTQVWAGDLPGTYYFAEGYTGSGFQEYLCLGNPGDDPAASTITYLFTDGSTQEQQVEVPAKSRFTVNVNATVGPDKEVSVKVEYQQSIVAERPMYFDYRGMWSGGHDTIGATIPSNSWYFAEGYTGPGFEEWICVLNPGDAAADLIFRFQTQEEGLKEVTGLSVAAHSRASFKVNQILGNGYQTSLELTSTQPVVAERPMYFTYQGTNAWNWEGGHCVMGAPNLAREYYFAEGTTRSEFEEWITLQNPNAFPITVEATYQLGPGQGEPVPKSYTIEAGRRFTIFVPSQVGTLKDVSVHLDCASVFLAERPMYFDYLGMGYHHWQGGHCVIGVPYQAGTWFFAEGFTGNNFEEWLCIQNTGDAEAKVEVAYYTQEVGPLAPSIVPIAPKSRYTLPVNMHAGVGYQLSCRLRVTEGPDIMVERPMYFNYNGTWDGGHDVVGYAP